MRILVIGASGMLGSDLVKHLGGLHEVVGAGKSQIEITDREATIGAINSLSPAIVINTAAYTDVDGCESDREKAFMVNRNGAGNVAMGCRKINAKLIHISTDYIFDGRKNKPYVEDDEPHPLNIYGLSKLEGEKEIRKVLPLNGYLIVRTSWLFGKNGKNFISTILKLSKEKDELKVVNDQIGSPTYTIDLSEAIERLINNNATGIVNVTNSGECSWYDYAIEILRLSGNDRVRVLPIKTEESERAAPRPPYSVLNNGRYRAITGHSIRHWRDALREYIRTMNNEQ